MSKSLEEQKDLLIDAVLELQKKLNALKYILAKRKLEDKPEIKVAIGIFNDFLFFLHGLLWDSIVINLYWLYDIKGERSIYWYLDQLKMSDSSFEQKINKQVAEIDNLKIEIKKVKRFRNKWVAHKDKEPYERAEDFWKKEERLTIEEVEKLIEVAAKIVQIECPISDLTNSGIHKMFALTDLIVYKNPEFLQKMKEYGIIERLGYLELNELCHQLKKQ